MTTNVPVPELELYLSNYDHRDPSYRDPFHDPFYNQLFAAWRCVDCEEPCIAFEMMDREKMAFV